ncbi:hypothetical protein RND81_14G173700 [Saponaria officinalis]|uniref:S-protein homolog n=1 Tax=Saponaria officinalis TaxID=3572 RepID=A0AAW1GYY0_SAPOF
MVVRIEEKVFRVYKLTNEYMLKNWAEVKGFDDGKSLCMSRDCYFFKNLSVGKEYENCIVFTEAGFPKYGDDGSWEYKCEDEIWVFRLSDGSFGRVGGSVDFPEIDWSPPWIFDVREPDEDDGDV